MENISFHTIFETENGIIFYNRMVHSSVRSDIEAHLRLNCYHIKKKSYFNITNEIQTSSLIGFGRTD